MRSRLRRTPTPDIRRQGRRSISKSSSHARTGPERGRPGDLPGHADAQRRTAGRGEGVARRATSRPRHSLSRAELRRATINSTSPTAARSTRRPTACSRSTTPTSTGKPARALFTQFEAADARRFVPSWDEPDYKATFDLTARVPANQMAVGNMPVDRLEGPSAAASRRCTFQTIADDVVLPAVLRHRRFRAHHQAGRRPRSRHRDVARQRRQGPLRARRRGADPALLQRLFRHALSAAQARQRRRARRQSQFFGAMENWGAIFTFEHIAAARSGDHQRGRQAGDLRRRSARNGAPCGSATSSPWRGGTTCGSTKASPAGWRTRPPSISIPTGAPTSTRSATREEAMALDAFATTHPVVQTIRTVEQANQAFDDDHLRQGRVGHLDARGLRRRGRLAAGHPRLHAPSSPTGIRERRDLWAAVEGAGAKGLIASRARLHDPARHSAVQLGASRCVNGQTVVPADAQPILQRPPAAGRGKPARLAYPDPDVRRVRHSQPAGHAGPQCHAERSRAAGCCSSIPARPATSGCSTRPNRREALRRAFGT